MDSKYYVPGIEEFHNGFEYEFYKAGTDSEYISCIFRFDTQIENLERPIISDIYSKNLQEGWLRVKYLDKEDIESFGFNGNEHYLRKGDIEIIAFQTLDRTICVHDHSKCHPIFIGIIKNKSELKVLLKQLQII